MILKESFPCVKLIYKQIDKCDKSFKISILGDCRVGKTSLIKVAKGETFKEEYKETIACELNSFGAEIYNKIIKFNNWDMTGHETYRIIINKYAKNSSLIILVYDITNRNSFENIDTWINDIKSNSKKSKIILVGNKSDLEDERAVTEEEGKEKCELNKLTEFMECSCKNVKNVQEIFIKVAKILYNANNLNLENEGNSKEDNDSLSYNSEENVLKKSIKIKKRSCPCCPFSCC